MTSRPEEKSWKFDDSANPGFILEEDQFSRCGREVMKRHDDGGIVCRRINESNWKQFE